ncbi:zinc finger protein 576-like isoform X2 [Grus americana]|uniref:zinc finger protein 576-like isoform X2 n=1 Tax=Grus americana TaxID=9117 RepID=UPI0024081493|nr:zinc finger protein 576-like isoform X2 [Grus americana]
MRPPLPPRMRLTKPAPLPLAGAGAVPVGSGRPEPEAFGPPGMSQPPPPEPPPPGPPPRQQQEEEEEEEEGGGGGASPEPRPKGCGYRLGSTQCRRCLITFPDAAFAARHAKRQHPRDFAAAALRGAQFVCFVCARPFASSPALLRHQRAHAPPPAAAAAAARHGGATTATAATTTTPAYACTECGRAFAREGALHRHYIRHARGEL